MSSTDENPYRDVSDASPDGDAAVGGSASVDDASGDARSPDGTGDGGDAGSSPDSADPPAPSLDPERDADLAPFATDPTLPRPLRFVVHAVFWTLYAPVFPWHGMAHVVRTTYSVRGRVRAYLRSVTHLVFFGNRARGTLYLRASWVPTPATVLPFVPGTKPVAEDPTVGRTEGTPEETRTAVLRRDDYVCLNCGAGGGPHGETELHVDHAVPASRGGGDHPGNLRTLCRGCHQARHGRRF